MLNPALNVPAQKSLHDASGKRLLRNGKALLGQDGDVCCCGNATGCCPCPCKNGGGDCINSITADFSGLDGQGGTDPPNSYCLIETGDFGAPILEYRPIGFARGDFNSTFTLDYCPQYCRFQLRTDLYQGLYKITGALCSGVNNTLLRKQRMYIVAQLEPEGPNSTQSRLSFSPGGILGGFTFGILFDGTSAMPGPCGEAETVFNDNSPSTGTDSPWATYGGQVSLTKNFGASANTDPQQCTGCRDCYKLTFNILGVDYIFAVHRRAGPGACDCNWQTLDNSAGTASLSRGCNYWFANVVLPDGTTTEPQQGQARFSAPVDGTGCPPTTAWTIDDAEPGATLTVGTCAGCATDVSGCCTTSASALITQAGSGINGGDIEQQWASVGGPLPMTSTDGQVNTELSCPSGDKYQFKIFVTSDPTLYVIYEEEPDIDGCPPTTWTNKIANTWGVDSSAVVTITC